MMKKFVILLVIIMIFANFSFPVIAITEKELEKNQVKEVLLKLDIIRGHTKVR